MTAIKQQKKDMLAAFHKAVAGVKTGMYEGMDAVSREMEARARAGHSGDPNVWWNEPLGRTEGDLSATMVGFVVPGAGDEKYLKDHRDVMSNYGNKSMSVGDPILDRNEQVSYLTDYQMSQRHVADEPLPETAHEPMVVRAFVSSPLVYEKFQEDPNVPNSYPVLGQVLESMVGEVIPTLRTSMSNGLRLTEK